jgi:hypothetical protein
VVEEGECVMCVLLKSPGLAVTVAHLLAAGTRKQIILDSSSTSSSSLQQCAPCGCRLCVCAAVATRCAATSAYRELPTALRRLV